MAVTSHYRKKLEKDEVKRLSKEVQRLGYGLFHLTDRDTGGEEACTGRLQIWACQRSYGEDKF
jgi:hypothetical protein